MAFDFQKEKQWKDLDGSVNSICLLLIKEMYFFLFDFQYKNKLEWRAFHDLGSLEVQNSIYKNGSKEKEQKKIQKEEYRHNVNRLYL